VHQKDILVNIGLDKGFLSGVQLV